MRPLIITGLGGLLLAACHGAECAGSDPQALRVEAPAVSVFAARQTALDEVRERHPSRALVDFANVEQTATDPAVYMVHVEMTGAPEIRGIYDVEVSETEAGRLEVTGLTRAQ